MKKIYIALLTIAILSFGISVFGVFSYIKNDCAFVEGHPSLLLVIGTFLTGLGAIAGIAERRKQEYSK